MHADLVRAAGLQPAGDQARDRLAVAPAKRSQQLPMRDRRRGRPAHGRLSRACGWRSSGASIVPCGRAGAPQTRARYPRSSGPSRLGRRTAPDSAPVRLVGLGDDQQAGRVLVEPVHDARPLHAADAGEARRRNARSAR